MAPDLILTFNGRRVAVGDAKYIELDPAGWKNANMYQLLAYCVAMGLSKGLLIYANYRPFEVHRVDAADIDLEVIGLDMTVSADQLVLAARSAATRLIEHARARVPVAA